MELESAFQELLSRLEFVSLPGLGSFVKKYEPASLSTDGKLLNPPREYFIFDTSRTFDDEALTTFVVENVNVDHKKATEIVGQFIAKIKVKLASGTEVMFPGVGSLRLDTSGNIDLVVDNETISQTFGLEKVELTPNTSPDKKIEVVTPRKKEEIKPELNKRETPVSAKSKNKYLVPAIAIAVILAVTATLVFVPQLHFWKNYTIASNEQVVQANTDETIVDTVIVDETRNDSLSTSPDSAVAENENNIETSGKPIVAVTDKKAALYYQETSQVESKTFYIVAGSFSQENNAQKLIQELSNKGYKPILLQTDNIYRVAIYKFTSRDRALRELERLKSQNISDKIWLLSL